MSNKKQTAVEWFAEMTAKLGYVSADIFEQAKEMEKEQKMKDYFQGRKDESSSKARYEYNRNSEQYYNETYGGNG
jgi:hypothetical protein